MQVKVTRELILTKTEERMLARLKTLSEDIAAKEAQRVELCAELADKGFTGRDVAPYAGVNYTTVLRWAKLGKQNRNGVDHG